MLSELYRAGYLARLGGNPELASRISVALRKFSKSEVKMERDNKKEVGLDSLGRANGSGRRKTATARVWLVPSRSAAPFIDGPAQAEGKNVERAEPLPFGEVLVNQLPMAKYFGKVQDRAAVLRPLRLAGLLGAYNIHALVQGGGSSGQSQAVALALARAIVITRPETKDVLYAGELGHFPVRSKADDRWCDDEESEDGREEEDQLAQGQESGKSRFGRWDVANSSVHGSSVNCTFRDCLHHLSCIVDRASMLLGQCHGWLSIRLLLTAARVSKRLALISIVRNAAFSMDSAR